LALIEWRARDRRWLAVVYAVGAIACLAGIVVSFSRGAWLGAGIAALVLVLPLLRSRFKSWALVCLLVCGVVLAGVYTMMFALRGSIGGGSTGVRLLFWREALTLIERRPFGLGLDQFYYYHNPVFGHNLSDPALMNAQDRAARSPHNLVFELWLNLGPLGVLAMAGLLARAIKRAGSALVRAPSTPAGFLALGVSAALAAALAHGLVDMFYFWPDLAITFWLLLALLRYGLKPCPEQNLAARVPLTWRSFFPAQAAAAQRGGDLIATKTMASSELGGVASDVWPAGDDLVTRLGRGSVAVGHAESGD
jgi:O-antigen ligase